MSEEKIFLGNQELKINTAPVQGNFISVRGENLYKIANYDNMDPFLISIVSASDHWMYISSNGSLTAGRRNPDNALFPYLTDDQIHDNQEITGSKTIIKVFKDKRIYLWEPFSERLRGIYLTNRNLYKNIFSTKIIFEEINHDLGLVFKYGWTTSVEFGFVKFSEIINFSDSKVAVEILDGIQNILPSGITKQLQTEYSTLVDGYKKNELIENCGLGLFSLSSIPSDMALPSESLTTTTVCSVGVNANKFLLSSRQLDRFRENLPLKQETISKGVRGSYFINSYFNIKAGETQDWLIIAEINQDPGDVAKLKRILEREKIKNLVSEDIQKSQISLWRIVAQADGLQLTKNKIASARHFSNVLFNIMRGGVFYNSYFVDKRDFILFVEKANPFVLNTHKNFLQNLPEIFLHSDLVNKVKLLKDPHFDRLALEYLPLTFSRRHGDPSRPWNKFSIEIKNDRNEKVFNYQGNWRDVFQNWEALALSYPRFLEAMISKFLNDSTADGYNPYRISRDGFDWEVQEPDNPWANLGYWGDHQIIYLLKLLELSKEFNPHSLESLIDTEIFTYANVPYRIKEYHHVLNDPRNTIEFDHVLDHVLKTEEKIHGSDIKFLKKPDYSLVQVNLIEKLLLTLLVKMSNYVPGGGIWMNTQRPEWNDANNALVGNGISMVTLFYLRRYLTFLKDFVNQSSRKNFSVSKEIADFFSDINQIIFGVSKSCISEINGTQRKNIVDRLGTAGSDYRIKIYTNGFCGEKKELTPEMITGFSDYCLTVIDQTIKENKREDGLYHSYNVLHISTDEMKVTHLYEMLEGQVAALSSGYLSIEESIDLLTALKKSRLYRKDQNSYILYPDKDLPLFIEKNNISLDLLNQSELLKTMLEKGNEEIIYKDVAGGIHFQSDIINSNELKKKLRSLSNSVTEKYTENEETKVLDIYEKTFCHNEFTGRANTFYKYEGLGSIYWHMVSKLLLAVQEVYFDCENKSCDPGLLKKIKNFYYDIKDGIGAYRQPSEFGAFPTDPYSHTPSFAGAQQPGMTGQVKEDIISRFGEVGIKIKSGKIFFNTSLLKEEEFLDNEEDFAYCDLNGKESKIICKKKSFVITYCQVPFIYKISNTSKIVVLNETGGMHSSENLELEEKFSQSIFNREGKIKQVEVYVNNRIFNS